MKALLLLNTATSRLGLDSCPLNSVQHDSLESRRRLTGTPEQAQGLPASFPSFGLRLSGDASMIGLGNGQR